MQLNYFRSLLATMSLLPGIRAKKNGHVPNVSSWRPNQRTAFQALYRLQCRVDAWTRGAVSEFSDQGESFTTINMSLLRIATRLGTAAQLLHAVLPRVA